MSWASCFSLFYELICNYWESRYYTQHDYSAKKFSFSSKWLICRIRTSDFWNSFGNIHFEFYREGLKTYLFWFIRRNALSIYIYHASGFTYNNFHLLPKTSHVRIFSGDSYKSSIILFSLHKDQDQINIHFLSVKDDIFLTL